MNISINKNAPVKSTGKIEIKAPIDKVWQILTSIDNWPTWQSEVTKSNLQENLKEGSIFKRKAGGLPFTSQIYTVEPKIKLGWTGKTISARAIHNWFFAVENNNTIVKVEESLEGVFPKLFKSYFQRKLDMGIRLNLEDLKRASLQ